MIVSRDGRCGRAAIILWAMATGALAADRYLAVRLPFVPHDINGRGQIVGVGVEEGSPVVYGWLYQELPDGPAVVRLEPFPGQQAGRISTIGISEDGNHIVAQSVGNPVDAPVNIFESRAVEFLNGVGSDLGALPGSTTFQGRLNWALASDVNNAGVAVGMSNDSTTAGRPVIFRDGQVVEIEPGRNRTGSAVHIADDGGILGNWLSGGTAAYHREGGTVPLNPVDGHGYARVFTASVGGVAAGISRESPRFGDPEEIVTWDTRSVPLQPTSHGAFPEAISHQVRGVSDSGVLVGWVTTPEIAGMAFLRDADGFHALDELIEVDAASGSVRVTGIAGMNGSGWIIGSAEFDGTAAGLLLKPLPSGPSAVLETGGEGGLSVAIRTEPGRRYRLESTGSLDQGFPSVVAEFDGDGSVWSVPVDPRDAEIRLYRFRVVPGPE